MSVLNRIRNCEDCARRRAEWAAATRRMAESLIGKKPEPPPIVHDPDVEARALARFLRENIGATANDWACATEELRHNYRVAVQVE